MGSKSRSWVSPVTAISFIVLAVTGMFMFFHVRIPGFHVLHEMMGILFCIVGIYHVILNWRVLLNYVRTRAGIAAVAITTILGILLFMGGADHEREEGMRGGPHGPHSLQD